MLKLYYFNEDDIEVEIGVNDDGDLYLCNKDSCYNMEDTEEYMSIMLHDFARIIRNTVDYVRKNCACCGCMTLRKLTQRQITFLDALAYQIKSDYNNKNALIASQAMLSGYLEALVQADLISEFERRQLKMYYMNKAKGC